MTRRAPPAHAAGAGGKPGAAPAGQAEAARTAFTIGWSIRVGWMR